MNHPLILHLRSIEVLGEWACDIPAYAWRLAEELWPGPLTLLLRRRLHRVYDHFGGMQPFVAVRVPAHEKALALLAAMDDGLVAPSANRFGRVSPTEAVHVLDELGDLLVAGRDVLIDGGASEVGVESAILDCTEEAPAILRPGAIGADTIQQVGGVSVSQRASKARAPGTLPSHYAPQADVIVAADPDTAEAILSDPRHSSGPGPQDRVAGPVTGLLALDGVPTPSGVVRLAAPSDSADYARCLYGSLRKADALRLARVVAIPPPGEGIGLAIRDRLVRAAAER